MGNIPTVAVLCVTGCCASVLLLGPFNPLHATAGTTARTGTTAPAQAAPAPQRAAAVTRPVDPLDELFGSPVPAAAPPPAPAAAPGPGSLTAGDFFGSHATQPALGSAAAAGPGMQGPPGAFAPAAAAAGCMGNQSLPTYGSYGMAGGNPMGPAASWGAGSLPPAASSSSFPTGDLFAPAARAMPGATAPAAPPGSVGFDDSAFGPADDWRLLGDVQQWHRALLTKDKVGSGGKGALEHLVAGWNHNGGGDPPVLGLAGVASCMSEHQPSSRMIMRRWQGQPVSGRGICCCSKQSEQLLLSHSQASNLPISIPHGACRHTQVWRCSVVLPCALTANCVWLQGILYEDTALQVGLQSRYNRSTGELLLFLGNKQAAQPLTGVSLVLSAPSLALQVLVGQLPGQLAPKQQVQVSTPMPHTIVTAHAPVCTCVHCAIPSCHRACAY